MGTINKDQGWDTFRICSHIFIIIDWVFNLFRLGFLFFKGRRAHDTGWGVLCLCVWEIVRAVFNALLFFLFIILYNLDVLIVLPRHSYSTLSKAASSYWLLGMKLTDDWNTKACRATRLLKQVRHIICFFFLIVILIRIYSQLAAERVYRFNMIMISLSLLLWGCSSFKRQIYLSFQAQELIILCCIIKP